jgi:multiple sugar transport system substrate-binding protein
MRRRIAMFVGFVLASFLVLGTAGTVPAETIEQHWTIKDIPEIKNKKTIHVAFFGGPASIEKYTNVKLAEFEKKTGIKVTGEQMVHQQIYPKTNMELIAGTGGYDVIILESSCTNEWAKYLYSLDELADMFEPGGAAAIKPYVESFDYVMRRVVSDQNGKVKAVPFWTYQMGMIYRGDVFEHPKEKAEFKKKYGYELGPATTQQHLLDQAQFFTRKKGQLLKGEPLKEDVWGVALKAGRHDINDELSAMIWGMGAHWASVIRDKNGMAKEFVITKKDQKAMKDAMVFYKKLLQYTSPACLTGTWNITMPNFVAGKAIVLPYPFISQTTWANKCEEKVPGCKVSLYPSVGGQGYAGCFAQAVPKASKNPEAAYWFVKYIGSFEVQKDIVESGLAGVRSDVNGLPQYKEKKCWNNIGKRAACQTATWAVQEKYVDDYFHFNSTAMGKIYEAQIILGHEAAIGNITPDEFVDKMVKETVALQKKFGKLPIRVE